MNTHENNIDKFRQRTEIRGEISKIEGKLEHLKSILKEEYFGDVKMETRTMEPDDESPWYEERWVVKSRTAAEISINLFSEELLPEWDALTRKYVDDLCVLLNQQLYLLHKKLSEV